MKRLGDTHPVQAVAREAAVLRHPIAADADTDARLLGEGWREWTTATLLTQLNGYVYDQKISVFAGGRALSDPHEAFNAAKDEWQVDDAGRDLLVSLFLSDQAVVLPTFNVQPCPSAVPPILLLLEKQARVRLRWTWQRMSESIGSAADAIDVFAEAIARQSKGWLRIDEAAQVLSDAGRGLARSWRDKFLAAAEAGTLPTHEPGSYDRVVYEPRSSSQQPKRPRDFYELVHVDDLNGWLNTSEPRLPFRFDRPNPHATISQTPTEYQALLPVAERYAEQRLDELPADVAKFISDRIFPLTWDSLSVSHRREAAHQYDAQHDPALDAFNTYCFELHAKRDELEDEQRKVELMPAAIPSEYDLRRKLLADVKKSMDEVDAQLSALTGLTMDQVRNFKPEAPGNATVADAPKKVSYSLGLFARLEPSTEWAVSRLSHTDYIGLAEASELASLHAGSKVSVNDFLRAGGRGEIRVFARATQAATMKPTRPQDEPIDIPMGSFPALPMEACKTLALFGRAEWRYFEDWVPNEAFGGQMCSFERWRLPADALSMVTVTNDCLVFGREVHALADASRSGPEAPAPATPVQRHRAQEVAILAKLTELGFTPTALPHPEPGKPSEAKKAVKDGLGYSQDVMKKAWQRLRADGRIKEA